MDPTRRFFLKGLVIATTAPGVVKAENLMKLVIPKFSIAMLNPLNLFLRGDTDGERVQSKDFWSWTDIDNDENRAKLRALGINESFISGDVPHSTYAEAWSQYHREMIQFFRPETPQEEAVWADLVGPTFRIGIQNQEKNSEDELKRGLREMRGHIRGDGWASTWQAYELFNRSWQ